MQISNLGYTPGIFRWSKKTLCNNALAAAVLGRTVLLGACFVLGSLEAWSGDFNVKASNVEVKDLNNRDLAKVSAHVSPWAGFLVQPRNPEFTVLDEGKVTQFGQQYHDLVREYDWREKYRLNGIVAQVQHLDRLKGFAQYLFRAVVDFQIRQKLKKAEARSPEVRIIHHMHNSVRAASVRIADFRVEAGADLPRKKAQIGVNSPYADGKMEFSVGSEYDPYAPEVNVDPSRAEERFRVSVSRQVPSLQMGTSLSYGGSTHFLQAAVNRRVTSNLILEMIMMRSLASRSAVVPQEVLKVSYHIGF